MNVIIMAIGLLNLFDLWATLQWISVDSNMEANPIMRRLWIYNPWLFICAKIILTMAFCIIAYKLKSNKLMRRLIWLPFCVYVFIGVLHLIILI